MRVVIVSRGAFPGYDGPARRVKYLGAGLAGNGCDVAQIVAYPPSATPCEPGFADRYGYRYVHTMQRDLPQSASLREKVYCKIIGTLRVYGAAARAHADRPVDAILVCGVGLVELLVVLSVAWRFGIKVAVDKNDLNYRLKSRRRLDVYGLLSGINIALSESMMVRWVDRIFTVNTWMHELYDRRAPGRVRDIVPSFIDRRELRCGAIPDRWLDRDDGLRMLSAVTTPAHLYGFLPFAEAAARLRRICRFRLYVLSSHEPATLDQIQQVLQRHQIADITKILTRVPPEVIQSVYAGVDVLLNAQQEPDIAVGGFPGKTAELLASARPIVTTLFSDLHKYFVHDVNCLVVRYGDVDAYVNAMAALIDSPDERERLGRAGRATALEHFEYISATRALGDGLAQMCGLAVETQPVSRVH